MCVAAALRRALLIALLLVSVPALAGCTQLSETANDLQAKVDAAKQEAVEAKDRLDRVRSLTIVRTESLHLTVNATVTEGRMAFTLSNATRSNGNLVPLENITALPSADVLLKDGDGNAIATFTCEPLSCAISTARLQSVVITWPAGSGETVEITAADDATHTFRASGDAVVTTSAGDATA